MKRPQDPKMFAKFDPMLSSGGSFLSRSGCCLVRESTPRVHSELNPVAVLTISFAKRWNCRGLVSGLPVTTFFQFSEVEAFDQTLDH